MVRSIIIFFLVAVSQYVNAQICKDSINFIQRIEKIRGSVGVIEIDYEHFYNGDTYYILDDFYKELIGISSLNYTNSVFSFKDTITDLTKISIVFPFFKPLNFYFEPTVIQFECINYDSNYWKVFVNKDEKIHGNIKIDTSKYKYKDWYNYYLGSMVIIDEKSNIKIDTNDSEKVNSIDIGIDELYIISEIKGDWVKLICINDGVTICSKKYLWMKWINNNEILLNLAFTL